MLGCLKLLTFSDTWRWATDFDTFAGTAKSVGANAFITINYGSGSPQEAADWVAYSNNTRKYGFRYWEIGNECYGSWENDTHNAAHDPYTYAVEVRDYMTAMKAADPTIKIGVVVATGEDSFANYTSHPVVNPRTKVVHNGWTPVLFSTLRSLGVGPDFVAYHRYEQAPGQESDPVLLQSAATWRNDAADLRQQINDYFGAGGSAIEIDCTENNSVFSNPGKQTTSLVNGVYFADNLGQLIQTEFRSLVWWDMRNGIDASNNNSSSLYGWRAYGDYGITGENGAYPVYYTAKLMRLFMGAGDYVTPASSDYNLLSIAAVKQRSGGLALLVINKSPEFALTASVAVSGFAPHASAAVYRYGIPNDDNARTGHGSADITVTHMVNAGGTFSATFPPYSVTVLVLTRAR